MIFLVLLFCFVFFSVQVAADHRTGCKGLLDIHFSIDDSGSIGYTNFQKAREFLDKVVFGNVEAFKAYF